MYIKSINPDKSLPASYFFRLNAHLALTHWEFAFLIKATTFDVCTMTNSTLAKLLGCSVSTVQKVIRSLVEKGVLIRHTTIKCFRKIRSCYFNWVALKNLIERAVLKAADSLTRCGHHRKHHEKPVEAMEESEEGSYEENARCGHHHYPFDRVTITTNSKYYNSKQRGENSYRISAANKIMKEKSIVKIVGAVAGRIKESQLTKAEAETLRGIGGKSSLKLNNTELKRLCGINKIDFNYALAKAAQL